MTKCDVDLSVLLTLHSETLVAGPTLKSIEAAIALVEQEGFIVERLLGLDSVSPDCRGYIDQAPFDLWLAHETSFHDQGRVRNHLVDLSNGRWIAIMDGDDLCSENWLVEAMRLLRDKSNQRAIVHPELNWVFDGAQYVYINPASSSPLFSRRVMTTSNYFDAICVGPRTAWIETPYKDRDVENGFAFEDYQWAVETTWKGWMHLVAKDTIIFKRRRDSSQTHEARRHRVSIRDVDAHSIEFAGRTENACARHTSR